MSASPTAPAASTAPATPAGTAVRTALVTGASKGIGREIAERLARDGLRVAVHYGSDRAGAEAAVAAITAAGGRAFALGADLAAADGPGTLTDALRAAIGPDGHLDVLVHNAGVGESSGLAEITPEEYDRLFAVNVRAPLFLTQRLLPVLRDGGRIIAVSSGVTRIALPAMLPYAMTKGALEVLVHQLAQQVGPRGITVNAVAPGVIDTERTRRQFAADPGFAAYAEEVSALGRVGRVDDVAGIAAFLASSDGGWVTGQVIDATGGSHL
ncbi:SDR family oxidoreductase [Nocardiopsis trehalosi]|uniref:SDR family oxidoreductase n=1 Tax=Nocardiopsis trehalosi TaxID=109329 RepID=UPI000A069F3E|nr:SDR family oxidoreductase [Nocardiopsis trehalosi]